MYRLIEYYLQDDEIKWHDSLLEETKEELETAKQRLVENLKEMGIESLEVIATKNINSLKGILNRTDIKVFQTINTEEALINVIKTADKYMNSVSDYMHSKAEDKSMINTNLDQLKTVFAKTGISLINSDGKYNPLGQVFEQLNNNISEKEKEGN